MGVHFISHNFFYQKLLDEKLLESRQAFYDVFNKIELGIFISKPKQNGSLGEIMEVNQFGSNILGYTQKKLVHMSFETIIHPINNEFKFEGKSNQYVNIRTVFITNKGEKLPVILYNHLTSWKGKRIVFTIAREILSENFSHNPEGNENCDTGRNLRILMAEMDINSSELAQITNLTTATISNLRTGKVKRPNIETAEKIANSLGVKISFIWPHLKY